MLEEDVTEANQRNSGLCHMSKGATVKGKAFGAFISAVLWCAIFTVILCFLWAVKGSRWAARVH